MSISRFFISSFQLFVTGFGLLFAFSAYAQNEQDESVIQLGEYVVTGTKTERIINEAPVKTELIISEDFQDYNITSFKDALKLIPTARFESDCQNCGLNQIQLLGLSTDYTAILFDGAPLYSGVAKVYGADLFPAVFLDRIEVVKGGSSSLYGPEAIAGVVNLISSEPFENSFTTGFSVESLLGDATETEASFSGNYVDPNKKFAYKVYGLYLDREGLDLTTDGFTEIPQFENQVIGLQGWMHPLETSTLKLSYQYMDQSHRGGDNLNLPEEQARVAESLAHQIHMLHAGWQQSLSSGFDYSLRVSFMDIVRESFYGARGDNEQRAYEEAGFVGDVTDQFIADNQDLINAIARTVWGETDNDVLYLESQVNRQWEDHLFSFGVQYRFEKLEDGSLYDPTNVTTEDDFDNFGIFLQDQWTLSDAWEFVPGIRLDHHDNVDGSIISPRIATRYFASDEVTLRASWSTGFNAPGAFNEDQHIGVNTGGAISLINDSGLKEESSHTWSIGMEFMPAQLERQLILHSQIHYTQLEDSFDIDDSGDLSGSENIWLRVNGPDSTFFVWENNVNWQITEYLKLDSGLSFLHARFDSPVERVTGLITDEYIKRPEWTGHLGLNYENDEFCDAYIFLNYTGAMLAVGEDADIWRRTEDFWVLDIGISKEFENVIGESDLVLKIGVNNVFDQRQKDLINTGEERDVTYLYGPTQPRSYYLSTRFLW